MTDGDPAGLTVALIDPGGPQRRPRILLDACASGPALASEAAPATFTWPVWPDAAQPVVVLVNRGPTGPLRIGSVALEELSGDLPARRSAWPLTDLDRDPRAAAFRQQLDAVVSMPKVPEWEQIAMRVAARSEEVIRGARPLDDALAALDAEVDRILEKRRWMLDRQAAAAGRPVS